MIGIFVGTIYQINCDINNYQEGDNNTDDLANGKSRFAFPAFLGFNPSPPAAVFAAISPLVEEFQEVLVEASGVAASESSRIAFGAHQGKGFHRFIGLIPEK
jgi:hypothetical protein